MNRPAARHRINRAMDRALVTSERLTRERINGGQRTVIDRRVRLAADRAEQRADGRPAILVAASEGPASDHVYDALPYRMAGKIIFDEYGTIPQSVWAMLSSRDTLLTIPVDSSRITVTEMRMRQAMHQKKRITDRVNAD